MIKFRQIANFLGIKSKNVNFEKMVYLVVEIIGENNKEPICVFKEKYKAKKFAKNIDTYKIILIELR